MTRTVLTAAMLVTLAALVCAGAALVVTRRPAVALPVLLDLLLAASLLRLTVHPSATQLGGTALLVLVKRFATAGIRQAQDVRRDAGVRAAGR